MQHDHPILPDVLELACPALPTVRIGLVGAGQRGQKAIRRYTGIEGAEIRAVADVDPGRLEVAGSLLRDTGRRTELLSGDRAWLSLCERDDIDLVYVCTEWDTHTEIATRAMECGKHVAVEVPAATSVGECWQLVDTAERTRRHCFMLENCCFDPFAVQTLALAGQGRLGRITYCEGAYIHNLRDTFGLTERPGEPPRTWMRQQCAAHDGNPYPTHGLGPVALLANIHRGDRLDYLVSATTAGSGPDGLIGKINTTLLRTVRGVGIMLQLDLTTPRPYSRLQTVCGTDGFVQKYPRPAVQLLGMDEALTDAAALEFMERQVVAPVADAIEEGRRKNTENVMNFAMDSRLIYCLRHGLPLDLDVYDAAEWSCIAELSEQSAREGSHPVAVPDFTRGRWDRLHGHRFAQA